MWVQSQSDPKKIEKPRWAVQSPKSKKFRKIDFSKTAITFLFLKLQRSNFVTYSAKEFTLRQKKRVLLKAHLVFEILTHWPFFLLRRYILIVILVSLVTQSLRASSLVNDHSSNLANGWSVKDFFFFFAVTIRARGRLWKVHWRKKMRNSWNVPCARRAFHRRKLKGMQPVARGRSEALICSLAWMHLDFLLLLPYCYFVSLEKWDCVPFRQASPSIALYAIFLGRTSNNLFVSIIPKPFSKRRSNLKERIIISVSLKIWRIQEIAKCDACRDKKGGISVFGFLMVESWGFYFAYWTDHNDCDGRCRTANCAVYRINFLPTDNFTSMVSDVSTASASRACSSGRSTTTVA